MASGKEEGGQHTLTSQRLGLGRIPSFREFLFAQHLLGAAGRGADLLVQQGIEHTAFLLNLASQPGHRQIGGRPGGKVPPPSPAGHLRFSAGKQDGVG